MRCKEKGCDGVMEKTGELGNLIILKCVRCGAILRRVPEDLLSKSMRKAKRQREKAAQPKVDSITEEYVRCEKARTELARKKEARAAETRRRRKAVKEGRLSTLDLVMAEEAWKG